MRPLVPKQQMLQRSASQMDAHQFFDAVSQGAVRVVDRQHRDSDRGTPARKRRHTLMDPLTFVSRLEPTRVGKLVAVDRQTMQHSVSIFQHLESGAS